MINDFLIFFIHKYTVKYIRICDLILFFSNGLFYFIFNLKKKFIKYIQLKFFFCLSFILIFKIKTVFQGVFIFGFCLKKKKKFFDLYLEKTKVISFLQLKGFCDNLGFPISCIKYMSWTQKNINFKINFLIRILNLWWFKGRNKNKIMNFLIFILKYSIGKLYANKFKTYSIFKTFNFAGTNLNISLKK